MPNDHSLISLDALEARGAWGFVGVVRVGDHEAFRTLRTYPVPSDAQAAAERLLANVLGAMLAGEEGRAAPDDEPGIGPPRFEPGSRSRDTAAGGEALAAPPWCRCGLRAGQVPGTSTASYPGGLTPGG